MTLDPLCCKVAYAFPTGNRWSVAQFFFFPRWAYWSLCNLKRLGLRAAGFTYRKLHVCVMFATCPSHLANLCTITLLAEVSFTWA